MLVRSAAPAVAPVVAPAGGRAARVRLLREVLRERLVHGAPGAVLPAEAELCAGYREARNVVRDALDLLRREGLVERRQGKGTFAVTARPEHAVGRLYFVQDDLDGAVSAFDTLAIDEVGAPDGIAARLGVAVGSPLLVVERRTRINGQPFSVQTSLLPLDLVGGFLRSPSMLEWFDTLEAGGLQLGDAEQVIEATIADGDVAELLDCAPGAPLLLIERLLRLVDGRPVELGFVRCRGDRLAVRIASRRAVGEPPDAGAATAGAGEMAAR